MSEDTMLRITVVNKSGSVTFQLEGKLAGPWVREMEQCWQTTLASQNDPVFRLDLRGVTFIDAAGKEFLATAHGRGAEFVASGCLMRAVVDEIRRVPSARGLG